MVSWTRGFHFSKNHSHPASCGAKLVKCFVRAVLADNANIRVSQTTVSRLLPKRPSSKARRQSWRTFFRNHREHLAGMDFLRRRLRPSARSMGLQSGRERNLPHGIHPLLEPSPHPADCLVKWHALRVATHDYSYVDGGLACADSPSAISRSASSYASIAAIRARIL